MLTGKYQPGSQPPEGSRARDEKGGADMVKRYLRDDVLEAVQRLKPVADDAGLSLAQLAVAWVLQNDNVAVRDHRRVSRPSRSRRTSRPPEYAWTPTRCEAIDSALGGIPETDPSQTKSPEERPA